MTQATHQAGAYPSFSSTTPLGYFTPPPPPITGLTPNIKFGSSYLYTWVERGTARVKCLVQEHNTISLARAWARTIRLGVDCTIYDATAPNT